jgi:hypothetical protein
MNIELYDYQLNAISNLKNGSILCGGVGSGKSRTALGYYFLKVCQGNLKINGQGQYEEMKTPRDLYIITTAKKRDSYEWHEECTNYILTNDRDISLGHVQATIDSWNNIKKYKDVYGAFFIFDEQRLVGNGAWVKTFLNIARKNQWILLSATPGDQWKDYIPVFIANGFYKNKTDFNSQHCVFSRYSKYPKIERYVGEKILQEHLDQILVPMYDERNTLRHYITCSVDYDIHKFRQVYRDHWDPFENEPIQEAGKWVYLMRKVTNTDSSRIQKVDEIYKTNKRAIIFYNFIYELEILEQYCLDNRIKYAEWNGQRHEEIPKSKSWLYLVQYTAGCEGWNCTKTDTIIFYSQCYSYRTMEQAAGRIDRVNTPFLDLFYYTLRSSSLIDLAIYRKLKTKQNFNESSLHFTK